MARRGTASESKRRLEKLKEGYPVREGKATRMMRRVANTKKEAERQRMSEIAEDKAYQLRKLREEM